MTVGYHDVDAWVADALEAGDFCYARELVLANSENVSHRDKESFLAAIVEAETRAITAS